jgi:hypothetical protein
MAKIPNSQPSVVYQPAISGKALDGVEDGVWYFHLQLKNANGWARSTHFRFQIDTVKPNDFSIKLSGERDDTDPVGHFILSANDETSGIDHFSIKIDNGEEQTWQGKSGELYNTPILSVGEHTLFIKAFDKAGNYLADSVSLTVKALEAPVFIDYPQDLLAGEEFVLRGKTSPNSQVTIWIEKEGDQAFTETVTSDADGNFVLTLKDGLKKGIYNIWASVIDSRGAQSAASAKLTISVKQSDVSKIGMQAVNLLSIVIILGGP